MVTLLISSSLLLLLLLLLLMSRCSVKMYLTGRWCVQRVSVVRRIVQTLLLPHRPRVPQRLLHASRVVLHAPLASSLLALLRLLFYSTRVSEEQPGDGGVRCGTAHCEVG